MGFAQLLIISLASISVARAFVCLGEMKYKLRWFNYPIAMSAGLCGASYATMTAPLRSIVLLVAVAFAIIAVGGYQVLRRYLALSNR